MNSPSLVWFRQDLRLDDNPALQAALDRGGPVIPVYIRSVEEEGAWRPGEASDWWLHQSLRQLDHSLHQRGSRLVIRSGASLEELTKLAKETGAKAVFWNRRYEPASIARDKVVKAELRKSGLEAESFNGQLLFEPWEVETKEGRPYQVFTAFWRACLAKSQFAKPQRTLGSLPAPAVWPERLDLDSLQLEPTRPWAQGLNEAWQPGEAGAASQLAAFVKHAVAGYDSSRDLPAQVGTSRLSPHLHFGEISPRAVWDAVAAKPGVGGETYLKELGWREFAHHLLYHFPTTPDQPLRADFVRFPWEDNRSGLRDWQRGRTGFPIVDAGMRELWATGWMHNRVRMIVASFLVKDLRIHWRHGAAWFWDTLVDADLAANTLGWQWSAGCGADAAPYFRVFNPVLQSEKFDPDGVYLRRWIPELDSLPTRYLHAPWTAPREVLQAAGIRLGQTYPQPIVDHNEARKLALKAFEQVKRSEPVE
jgi:deoxyribodipyrimidine photo-lyase